jgi:ZIP family zinc transporter
MSFAQTVSLGAIAGFTIYLGLPISRLQKLSPRVRSFLTGTSAGILLFLLFDIVSHVEEPIETAVRQAVEGKASATDAILFLIIFVIGFGVGLLGLVAFESRFLRARVSKGNPRRRNWLSSSLPVSASTIFRKAWQSVSRRCKAKWH